jgi:hypothetical protein
MEAAIAAYTLTGTLRTGYEKIGPVLATMADN